MGRGSGIMSVWSNAPTMRLQDPIGLLWENWFFASTTIWPTAHSDGSAPDYHVVGTTNSTATVALALALAESGDIVIVPAGTYTEDITVPAGVTLRAAACSSVQIVGQVTLEGNNTLRGIEFVNGGDTNTLVATGDNVWFESCIFHPEGGTGTFAEPFASAGRLIFRRCLFTDVGMAGTPTFYYADGSGGIRYLEFMSCVFVASNQSGGFSAYEPRQMVLINNTFMSVGDGCSGRFFTTSPGPAYPSVFARNIVVRTSGSGADGALFLDTGYIGSDAFPYYDVDWNYCFGFPSLEDALAAGDASKILDGGHNVVSVYHGGNSKVLSTSDLVDLVNGHPGPRSSTPGLTTSANGIPVPLLDFNGFPFASNPSAGAIQNQGEFSALYMPWYDLAPLVGFGFTFSQLANQLSPDSSMTADANFMSHRQIACHINAYVQDCIHPSKGAFFVDFEGNYRLVVNEGTFNLNLTGDAVTLLGAFNQSNLTDTG